MRRDDQLQRTNLLAPSQGWVVLLLAFSVLGCGGQTYETRLEETNRYFKYREKLDKALTRQTFEDHGVVIRVPKGFSLIQGPGPEDDSNHDPRQPTFFRSDLPGILAAWQSNSVAVEEDDESVTERSAWIFLCTNHQRWLDQAEDAKIEPEEFLEDIASMLAGELRSYDPDSVSTWEYQDERVPRQSETAYVPRKDYSWIMLEDVVRFGGNDRVDTEVMLNVFTNESIQLALIAVTPKNLARRDLFYGPIQLSMETLKMSGKAPTLRAKGPQVGGGF
jgi:hypothetical protein